jgi:hypothetical protein
VDQTDYTRFFQPHDRTLCYCGGAGHAHRLAGQTSFAKEVAGAQDRDDRFFALLGNDGKLELACLNVEDGVRKIALREDLLVLLESVIIRASG